jgi:hypothetical protein
MLLVVSILFLGQPLLQVAHDGDGAIATHVHRVRQIGEVGGFGVIVKGGVSQLSQQTGLQLDGDLLQLYDGDVISRIKSGPDLVHASLFLPLNLVRGLVDALLEEAWWGWSSFQRPLPFNLLDDGTSIVEGLFELVQTGL